VAVEFTRKQFLKVWRGTRFISQHVSILEAAESATEDAEALQSDGVYEIKVGSETYYEVNVRFLVESSSTTVVQAPPAVAAAGGQMFADWPNTYLLQANSGGLNNPGNLNTEPHRTAMGKADIAIFQGSQNTTSVRETYRIRLANMFAEFPNMKLAPWYNNNEIEDSDSSSSLQHLRDCINDADAHANWKARDDAGAECLANFSASRRRINRCNQFGFNHATSGESLMEFWLAKVREFESDNEGGTDDLTPYMRGFAFDVCDTEAEKAWEIGAHKVTECTLDFNQDGTIDSRGSHTDNPGFDDDGGGRMQALGQIHANEEVKRLYGNNFFIHTNGGRDPGSTVDGNMPKPLNTNTYYHVFDARLAESQTRHGVRIDGTGYEIFVKGLSAFYKGMYGIRSTISPDGEGTLDRSIVFCEHQRVVIGGSETVMNADDAARWLWGWCLCMLEEQIGFCASGDNRGYVIEPDLSYIHLGDPESGTRSMGTFSEIDLSFSLRAPDETISVDGFYWEIFLDTARDTRVWVGINGERPIGGFPQAWPTGDTDQISTPPANRAAKKWQRFDSSTYVNEKTGNAMQGQDATMDGTDYAGTDEFERYGGFVFREVDV